MTVEKMLSSVVWSTGKRSGLRTPLSACNCSTRQEDLSWDENGLVK